MEWLKKNDKEFLCIDKPELIRLAKLIRNNRSGLRTRFERYHYRQMRGTADEKDLQCLEDSKINWNLIETIFDMGMMLSKNDKIEEHFVDEDALQTFLDINNKKIW